MCSQFLEQQHVNNLVFNTSISNGATSDPPSKHSTPSPCPSPMSFIPSKSNGPAIINDHTNRLQIVMDKPPTPTPVSYDLGQRGVQIVQMGGQGQQQQESQQLLSKQQLQIVMDSQDNSQVSKIRVRLKRRWLGGRAPSCDHFKHSEKRIHFDFQS